MKKLYETTSTNLSMTCSNTRWLKSLLRKWRTFRALPRAQRSILLEALYLFPLTALSLKFTDLQRTQNLLKKLTSPANSTEQKQLLRNPRTCDALTVARLSSTAAALMPLDPHCLLRSLVCSQLMQRQSLPHDLRIGARKNNNIFRAHAWIEYQQAPLGDPKAADFTIFTKENP